MAEDTSPDGEMTEWDSSKATLIRIDKALTACATASLSRDFVTWFRYLEFLRRECIVKLRHTTTKSKAPCSIVITDVAYCRLCHSKNLFEVLRHKLDMYSRTNHKASMQSYLSVKLDETELLLRQIMNDKGMLLRDGQDVMSRFRGG